MNKAKDTLTKIALVLGFLAVIAALVYFVIIAIAGFLFIMVTNFV